MSVQHLRHVPLHQGIGGLLVVLETPAMAQVELVGVAPGHLLLQLLIGGSQEVEKWSRVGRGGEKGNSKLGTLGRDVVWERAALSTLLGRHGTSEMFTGH